MILGINSPHFMNHTPDQQDKQIAALLKLGCKNLRISLAWPDLEPVKGNMGFAKSDIAVNKLIAAGINIVAILGGFPTWSNGGKPFNIATTDYEAWRNYCRSVDAQYGDHVGAFEIGNEQNTDAFWSPPNATLYTSFLAAANLSIVRCQNVIMGGVAGADPAFIDACVKAHALDYCDTVAYHPYPETLYPSLLPEVTYTTGWWIFSQVHHEPADSYTRLSASVKKPVWATEIGWNTLGYPSVTELTQAEYITHSISVFKTLNVPYYFYFQLWDEFDYSQWWLGRELGFGLLRHDFTEKPAFNAFKASM